MPKRKGVPPETRTGQGNTGSGDASPETAGVAPPRDEPSQTSPPARVLHFLAGPILSALGYLALFVALTWPLVRHPARFIVANHGDGFFDMLLFWYARQGQLLAPRVDTLYFPWGVPLGPEQAYWLVPYMSVPLQWVMPLPAAFNLLTGLFFVATGLTMFLVAREVGVRDGAAFLAGILLLLSPAYLNELTAGIPENGGMQWLLLYVWCGLRMRRTPSLRLALWAGLFFSLTWMGSWYLGAYAAMLTLLLPWWRLGPSLAVAVVLLAFPFWNATHGPPRSAGHQFELEIAKRLVRGEGVRQDVNASKGSLDNGLEQIRFEGTMQVLTDSADLSRLTRRYRMGKLMDVLPGLLLIGLAALGLWRAPRRLWPWGGVALLCLYFSLGPYLIWDGQAVTMLPTAWAYDRLPLVARMRPIRFMLPLTLCLALMAAFAVPRLRQAGTTVLVGLLVGLQVVEVFFVQVAHYQVTLASAEVPAFYHRLAQRPGREAVIEVPLSPYMLQEGQQLYYQTVHGQPMLNYNFVTVSSQIDMQTKAARNSVLDVALKGTAKIRRRDVRELKRLGFRHLVMHTEVEQPKGEVAHCYTFTSDQFERFRTVYGEPRDEGEGVLVFDMAREEPDCWTWREEAREDTYQNTVLFEQFAPFRGRPDGTYPLAVVTSGLGCEELRAWIFGDGVTLSAWQDGVCLGTFSHAGPRWKWMRLRLARPDGKTIRPSPDHPVTITLQVPAVVASTGQGLDNIHVMDANLWTSTPARNDGPAAAPSSAPPAGAPSPSLSPGPLPGGLAVPIPPGMPTPSGAAPIPVR